jgi:hypothetical protein
LDLPRAVYEDSNSSIENAFNLSRSPNQQQDPSLAQITILSGQDLDRSLLTPPNPDLLQPVDEMDEDDFRSIFSFAPSNILTLERPTSASKMRNILKRSISTNSSRREITMLTGKDNDTTLLNDSFKNGINNVSSQFSCAPTESRMSDFCEFEQRPQSSRIKPKVEKFKVPIIKKEPGSYVPIVKKPVKTDGPSTSRQSELVKSFCENMGQDEENVSYSVRESITVNGVQKRKHNCVCNLDPDAMFLHSMLPEFKNMSKQAKGEFKMKMTKMIFELSYPSNEELD